MLADEHDYRGLSRSVNGDSRAVDVSQSLSRRSMRSSRARMSRNTRMSWPRTMNAVPITTPAPKSKTAAQGSSDRLVAPGWESRVTPNGGIVLRPNIKRDDREHRSRDDDEHANRNLDARDATGETVSHLTRPSSCRRSQVIAGRATFVLAIDRLLSGEG